MKEIYYTYNNEALASCVFLSILQHIKTLDIACSCLILPFLFDDRTVKYLSEICENQHDELSLEQIMEDKPLLFTSFNKRYLSLLPITINSLMILSKSDQINISKEIHCITNSNMDNNVMGERFNRITKVIPLFLSIIQKHSTTQLYKLLKIQL
ncbi:MAG: DUF6521 family protein [Bacteroidales bacterium]|jgi:hypothetical protein|nr:DUF6521 family protein [Bacteroidales bacterium]